MHPKSKEQDLARDLYLHTDKTQNEIAEILNVDRKSVYLWVKNGKWEEMKIAARQAPGMILQELYNHIEAVNANIRKREPEDRCPTMEEIDKLRKLLKMTKDLDRKSTAMYMEVIEEIVNFFSRKDLDFCQKFTKVADRWVKATIGNNKFNITKKIDENVREIEKNMGDDIKDLFPVGVESMRPVVPHIYPDREKDQSENQNSGQPKSAIDRAQRGNDGEMVATPQYDLKPLPVQLSRELNDPNQFPISTQKNISENGELIPATTPPSPLGSPSRDIGKGRGEASPSPIGEGRGEALLASSPMQASACEHNQQTNNDPNSQPPIPNSPAPNNPNSQPQIPNPTVPDNPNSQPPITNSNNQVSLDSMLLLPPEQRPSPFRDGNILWVNHIDDVNDDERKMGDTIRRYPDMDEYEKFNRAVYEMRIKIEAGENEKREKEKQERKARNAKIITLNDYYRYRDILQSPAKSRNETIIIDGVERNKMAFQHNLRQLQLHEDNQNIMTDEEFLRRKAIDDTLNIMRRDG